MCSLFLSDSSLDSSRRTIKGITIRKGDLGESAITVVDTHHIVPVLAVEIRNHHRSSQDYRGRHIGEVQKHLPNIHPRLKKLQAKLKY